MSYITIVNDTPDPWYVKVGQDEAALRIATVTATVIGGVAAAMATAGAAAPLAAASASASGIVSILGVPTSALATFGTAATAVSSGVKVVGAATTFAVGLSQGIERSLSENGFVLIPPGSSYRFGKFSLSLWRQATCYKAVVTSNSGWTELLYMRPIFSGATFEGNLDHSIQWWINKWGTATMNQFVAG